jgi:hypothetical protein
MDTFGERYRAVGDPMSAIDGIAHTLDTLLELAAADEAGAFKGEPWPPNFGKPRGRRSWWREDWSDEPQP